MKQHVKIYEDFVNEAKTEALATSDTAYDAGRYYKWRITPEILIEAGVEFSNVNIDIKGLVALQQTIVDKIDEMNSLREMNRKGHDMSTPATKVEKEIEEAVKKYNSEAKSKFKEFARAIQAIKFPSDAGYTVSVDEGIVPTFEAKVIGEPNAKNYYQDLEERKKIEIFEGTINFSYKILPAGRRKIQTWENNYNLSRWWLIIAASRGKYIELPVLQYGEEIIPKSFRIDKEYLRNYVGYKTSWNFPG